MRTIILAFGVGVVTAPTLAGAQVASLKTSDATIMPDRRTVFIEKANVPGTGLIVVRAVRGRAVETTALGHVQVTPGETTGVTLPLKRPARTGEALVVMLHADYGRIGVYDRSDPVVLSVNIPASVVDSAPGQR